MNSRIPADLTDLPLDDPRVLQRLRAFIDWAHQLSAGSQVVRVVFGNEFDVHLAAVAVSETGRRPSAAALGTTTASRREGAEIVVPGRQLMTSAG